MRLHLQLQLNLPLHVVTQAAADPTPALAPDPAMAAAFYITFIVFYAAAKSTRNRLKNSRATIREMRISCGFYVAVPPALPIPPSSLHSPLPAPGAGEVKIFIFYFIKCRRRRWAKFFGQL